ncbi:folate/pteridine transporter, putative, partial [Trypanosoma cruzi marinkellei]
FFFVMNWYGENKNRVNRAEDAKFMRASLLEEKKDSSARLREEDNTAVAETDNHSMLVLSDEVCAGVPGEEEEEEAPPLPTCCCGVFEVNKEVARHNWRVVLYCLLVAAGSVVMAIVTVLGDIWSLLYACIAVSVSVCIFGFFALPLVIAKANLYLFISMALYIQLPGALDSFYMAKPDCLPDGPHFSFFFYNTVANIIGNIGGIVGILLFRYVFSKQSY